MCDDRRPCVRCGVLTAAFYDPVEEAAVVGLSQREIAAMVPCEDPEVYGHNWAVHLCNRCSGIDEIYGDEDRRHPDELE